MKIFSNYFEVIELQKHQLNVINFECSDMQRGFREIVELFKMNKKSDHPFIIFEENEKEMTSKTMNLLLIQGGELNYLHSKEYMKLLQTMILNQFETNPDLIKKYQELTTTMHTLVEDLSHTFDDFSIEFEFTEFMMEQVWKMLNIHIENEETQKMTTLDFRKLQISSWLKLINPDLPSLIIYQFPENDATIKETPELLQILEQSNTTVLCLSNSLHVIEKIHKEGIILIKKNGVHYDVKQLEMEMDLLNIVNENQKSDALLVSLAFFDFINYTEFMDESWKKFIKSSRF